MSVRAEYADDLECALPLYTDNGGFYCRFISKVGSFPTRAVNLDLKLFLCSYLPAMFIFVPDVFDVINLDPFINQFT